MSGKAFELFSLADGVLSDMSADAMPTVFTAWSGGATTLADGATHLGFVFDGELEIRCASGEFRIRAGMYFSVPGQAELKGSGRGIVVSAVKYRGFFQIGGPVEAWGRLNYIDGCTDSLLVPPIMMGDPCLNLLCFPPGTNQTQHTHPSVRLGMVVSGTGKCITPDGVTPLFPGQAFMIPAHALHSFATQDQPMRVIAYHPDSDFGATHENHPMINRTIVNGVSAALLDDIRTAS